MKLRPLHDKVLVKRTEEEETSSGGIILSGSAKEKPSQGTVVSVGPGKKNESGEISPLNVKEGDTVVFGQYGGNEIKLDGEELLILSESDIFGVIE
ncbi:MAG: co-chaperone GroES [Gammaproteobacteria bacterium TMED278]|jgi:chaperonin GroES|nr:co-chaperone GroES [Gammaproteobacteria bacterium]OUX42721.1 MAG: co-chaperone GroES [Gammaproteobacteria bacterium TMED278]RCL36539.1 MAG: co-chaperone GroES [SAR86 cluster bacterium]URQ69972.1 co-chaperone GroES [SAR86 cluster bacterium]|tara:strand:- start:870 stop:1157 length:288 start_codon:yes stop_codon:yes gene_type:complete